MSLAHLLLVRRGNFVAPARHLRPAVRRSLRRARVSTIGSRPSARRQGPELRRAL